jgi:hypothetical protein
VERGWPPGNQLIYLGTGLEGHVWLELLLINNQLFSGIPIDARISAWASEATKAEWTENSHTKPKVQQIELDSHRFRTAIDHRTQMLSNRQIFVKLARVWPSHEALVQTAKDGSPSPSLHLHCRFDWRAPTTICLFGIRDGGVRA